MDYETKKEFTRLRNLTGNKAKSDEELERQAVINLRVREFKSFPLFTDKDEQKLAETRYRSYLQAHEIESLSDLDTLRSLIYVEIFEARIQKQLNKSAEENKAPFDKVTKQLTDIQAQKLLLKKQLGIDRTEENKDDLTGLEILIKKFKDYINAHREEFSATCPHGTLVLFRRRVKNFDSMKHPWFAGRWFFNYEILKDVKDGRLSKQDAWRYLCCASHGGNYKPAFDKTYCTDYIDYCLEHWAEITDFIENK